MALRVLTEAEIRSVVDYDAAIGAVAEGFAKLARGEAILPPPMAIDIPEEEGEFHFKAGYLRGEPTVTLKAATGSWRNPTRGLPVGTGLFVTFHAATGAPSHILLDNGYLTELRTAAAGAVAALHLARTDAHRVGVLGSGNQARYQVEALGRVREITHVHVWSPTRGHREAYAKEMTQRLGLPVTAEEGARGAVEGMDIVITATPSRTPILSASWVSPGLHITAVGSDAPYKNEIDPAVLAKALVVVDHLDQCARLGELHHALEAGLVDPSRSVELGQVILGKRAGRTTREQLTLVDLTGVGVQDAAIAGLVVSRAEERGLGRTLG